tara:strand:- start:8291 stop:8725 length:435 start_codon:yes stop_codon:yes gene_type:complete
VGHKYKDKYVSIRDIYEDIKSSFGKHILYCNKRKKKVNRSIDYQIYYSIIKRFFEILIRDVVERNRLVDLPSKMGYVCLEEKPHDRAFHVRVDNRVTKEKGKTVFYKVPILDDFYKTLVWVRPSKYGNCKILSLGYSKKLINKN